MRNIALSIFSLLLLSFMAQAQAPQAFNYQAVVRDAAGQVQANTAVELIIELYQNDSVVYKERHNDTTNAFGLINLKIGRGTSPTSVFSKINWSIPAFVRISLNGAIMGKSELLSVPYALYAANGLPADAQTGDLLYYNGTAWQRLPKGKGGQVLTLRNDGMPAWSGPTTDGLLEVPLPNGDMIYTCPVDNNAPGGVRWGGTGTNITALTDITTTEAANMDFNGYYNTAVIVAQLGTNNGTPYAAKLCADLVAYGFDDWYLPAAGELNEMYLKLGPNGSGQITIGLYWSSSEFAGFHAWLQYFADGDKGDSDKDINGRCRCVRR